MPRKSLILCGESAGIRTQDPRLKRAMLYQLSYRLSEQGDCTSSRVDRDGREIIPLTRAGSLRRVSVTRKKCRDYRERDERVRRPAFSGLFRMMVSSRRDPVEIISILHSVSSSILVRYRLASAGNFL